MEFYGVRFFMVHNKKFMPKDIGGYDVILYGHSHRYEESRADGRLLLNPGSCGPGRFTQPITFAVLTIGEDRSLRVEKIEIAREPKRAGSRKRAAAGTQSGREMADCGRTDGEPDPERELTGRDGKKLVTAVMRDTDRRLSVGQIAARNGISEELAEQICRLYLTHPGVSADKILGKMGL